MSPVTSSRSSEETRKTRAERDAGSPSSGQNRSPRQEPLALVTTAADVGDRHFARRRHLIQHGENRGIAAVPLALLVHERDAEKRDGHDPEDDHPFGRGHWARTLSDSAFRD